MLGGKPESLRASTSTILFGNRALDFIEMSKTDVTMVDIFIEYFSILVKYIIV